jgi:filamentous hemagglutinin family protein
MKAVVLVLIALVLMIQGVVGNPSGANIVSGDVTIGSSGNTLNINQTSNKSIIDWNDFSIGNGEITNFNLPDANSSVLNRVVGLNQSIIDGVLNSNGNVFLINENGILITQNGLINVNSFIGSTLDVSNDDFMSGKALNFVGNEGDIINHGTINANGSVILISSTIDNHGTINSPEVYLREVEGENASIKVKMKHNQVEDAINDHNGNVYGLAINQRGVKRGKTVVLKNGKTWLVDQRGNSPVYEFNEEELANTLGFKRNGKSDNYKIGKDTIETDFTIDNNGNLVEWIEPVEIIPNDPIVVVHDVVPAVIDEIDRKLNPVRLQDKPEDNFVGNNAKDSTPHVVSNNTELPTIESTDAPVLPYKNKEHVYDTYFRDNSTEHDYNVAHRGNKVPGMNIVMSYSYTDFLESADSLQEVTLDNFVNLQ